MSRSAFPKFHAISIAPMVWLLWEKRSARSVSVSSLCVHRWAAKRVSRVCILVEIHSAVAWMKNAKVVDAYNLQKVLLLAQQAKP